MSGYTRCYSNIRKRLLAECYRRKCEKLCLQFREVLLAGVDRLPPKKIYREFKKMLLALGRPKWEELDRDCWVIVLQKAGLKSLVSSAPYVCKTWHEANLDPKCWEDLAFPEHIDLMMERLAGISMTAFMRAIVDHSGGHATSIMLSNDFSIEALEYVGNQCPALKSLALHHPMAHQKAVVISNQISKWGNLETETLMRGCHMKKIVPQISLHFKNFTDLRAPQSYSGEDEASLIVTHLPKIKHLSLEGSTIEGETLVMIILGCKELASLDARDCTGFKADDAGILQLASHIPAFKCEGSRDFKNYRHRLVNGVPQQELEEDHIDIEWDRLFHKFG